MKYIVPLLLVFMGGVVSQSGEHSPDNPEEPLPGDPRFGIPGSHYLPGDPRFGIPGSRYIPKISPYRAALNKCEEIEDETAYNECTRAVKPKTFSDCDEYRGVGDGTIAYDSCVDRLPDEVKNADKYPGETADKELLKKNGPPLSCLNACHLDACMKQESHKQAYKDCRLNCPAWNQCMASQKCSIAEALDMSCDRSNCYADNLCGKDCVAGNTIDIQNLAGEKCACVRSCYTNVGFTDFYIPCKEPRMYNDCYQFLKGLKPPTL